jgi:peptide chain release factor 2
VSAWDAQTRAISDAEVLLELAEEASDEASAKEAAGSAAAVQRALDELEFKRMLSGELDPGGAIVQVTSGAGGVDASDWAQMLLRMLIRYCERHSWKVEVLEETPAEEAGIKQATIAVAGDYAYGLLKAENGVHRLVRVSPFDANGRRQTSFAAVQVTADIDDDIEVDINEVDLKIDTYRAGGAGGQHVNKTDSAVRITHLPTGIVVSMQDEKSQIQNRAKALIVLRSRLLKAAQDAQASEQGDLKRSQLGSGGRSEKIRTYNFKENRVTDHRINMTTYTLDYVLAGYLDPFVDALLAEKRARQLGESDGR